MKLFYIQSRESKQSTASCDWFAAVGVSPALPVSLRYMQGLKTCRPTTPISKASLIRLVQWMALFATVQVYAADPTRYLLSTWKPLWTIVSPFDTRCPGVIFLNAFSDPSAADEVVALAMR